MMMFGLFVFALSYLPYALCASSDWVTLATDGSLQYKKTPSGDQIMDFSSAGYGGGGVPIPTDVPVFTTITPSGGDDTNRIQSAINNLAGQPLKNGFRGVIVLAKGSFTVSKALLINDSGIIVRGSGVGSTSIEMKKTSRPYPLFHVEGRGKYATVGSAVAITSQYTPSGSRTIKVADSSKFSVGQSILIMRTITADFVKFMKMDNLYRDGKKQTWLSPGKVITTERVIASISGNTITLDVPMPESMDSKYFDDIKVQGFTFAGRIQQVGVESLTVTATPTVFDMSLGYTSTYKLYESFALMNGWVQNIKTEGIFNVVEIGAGCKQITVKNIDVTKVVPKNKTGAKSFVLDMNASTQLLFDGITALNLDNIFYVGSGSIGQGPFVIRNCKFSGNGSLQPHMRWSVGMLTENTEVSGGGSISYITRGTMG
jgi:hypothetical protein